ncbi:MAG TPA: glycosyltransferase, partial [Terriglobia bacterium]|nr:glycosyltransferase [Terriglobia bacterium]
GGRPTARCPKASPPAERALALVVLNVLFEERFGGPQSLALQVAERLQSKAVETIIAIPRGDQTFRTLLRAAQVGCRELDLARPRKTPNPFALARFASHFWPNVLALRRLIRESNATLVHTNGLMNLQAAMAARLEGVRLVWHLNDLGAPRAVRRVCLPFLRSWADRIAVGARAIGEFYFPNAHAMAQVKERLHVVYPPVDPERFSPAAEPSSLRTELGISTDAPVIGTVANLSPGKGIEFLIEAAPRIKQRVPGACFIVVGEKLANRHAYWSALTRRIEELGLARDFVFTGPRRDMPGVYRAMTVYAHPSESEGCSVAVLEASSSGLPVVATDVGGTGEAVEHGVTGLLIGPRRPIEIADAVIHLLESPAAAERMALAARARMIERFSLDLCVQEHLRMYHAALDHAAAA